MLADKKTIIRRISDYLHKYGTDRQVMSIASLLQIPIEEKTPKV